MIRMVYLAYPIDANAGGDVYGVVEKAKYELLEAGVAVVYDPGDAFKVGKAAEIGDEIALVNGYAQESADAVLAVLPLGVPTVGVPIEIERAARAAVPCAIITDIDYSWMLGKGLDYDGVRKFGFDQLEEACAWLSTRNPSESEPLAPLPFLLHMPKSKLPTRTYADDAGLDLYVLHSQTIASGQFVDIDCGVSVQLPEWAWGQIAGRSSTLRRRGLLVNPGVIDTGWRGRLFAGVWNLGRDRVEVKQGERIAQLIIMMNGTRTLQPVEVKKLTDSPRGTDGFGSSGP